MPTLNGIAYEELPGSLTLEYTPGGIVGRRQFLIAWADRQVFVQTLLGYTTVTGHVPIRTLAQKFPGKDYLYCTHARERPVGELGYDADGASYPQVEIHTEYHPWNLSVSVVEQDDDYDAETEEARKYIEESYEFGAEFVSAAKGNYVYTGTADVVDKDVAILVGTQEIMLHSPWEPELKTADIQTCLGKVNNARFYNYPAGQVLFMGASARRVITSEGEPGWAVTYRFRAKSVSFNKVYRGTVDGPHPDGWWEVTPNPYESTNLGILLDA